jgi:hypothetical protein
MLPVRLGLGVTSAVAKPHNAFTLENVDLTLLERPLFYIGGHYVTFLGLIAFAAFLTAGFIVARILQSPAIRRVLSRFKIDNNLIALLTTLLSLAALIFFIVSAISIFAAARSRWKMSQSKKQQNAASQRTFLPICGGQTRLNHSAFKCPIILLRRRC